VVIREIDLPVSLDGLLVEVKESVSACKRAVVVLIASCQSGESMVIGRTARVSVSVVFMQKKIMEAFMSPSR
jgi:hypothetical protein